MLATIVGTPGIGKSRLAREFLGSVEREARVLVGRCVAPTSMRASPPGSRAVSTSCRARSRRSNERRLPARPRLPAAGDRPTRADSAAAGTRPRAPREPCTRYRRIAHVLIAQGRDDYALAELEQAREISGSSASWKTARARLLARAGATAEAAGLARDAAASVAGSDDLTARADILADLSQVLHADGDHGGATETLAEAVSLHGRKGNVLPARHCRELLATICGSTALSEHSARAAVA
jgi:hypothetical protein